MQAPGARGELPGRKLSRHPVGPWRSHYRGQLRSIRRRQRMEQRVWIRDVLRNLRLEVEPPEFIPVPSAMQMEGEDVVIPGRRTPPPQQQSQATTATRASAPAGVQHRSESAAGKQKVLDGFMILEYAQTNSPDDVTLCVINGQGLEDVAQNEIALFSELAFVDLGENHLPLHLLESFPAVQEIHLHCNLLRRIEPLRGFSHLQYLDISFNCVEPSDLPNLGAIPKLKVLDLSGNGLAGLPADLSMLRNLERLILEGNDFEQPDVFFALGTLPKLKELDISDNKLEGFPAPVSMDAFAVLEFINLSSNCIADEQMILALSDLPSLQEVLVWENPFVQRSKGVKPELREIRESLVDAQGVFVMIEPPPLLRAPPIVYNHEEMTKVEDEYVGSTRVEMAPPATLPLPAPPGPTAAMAPAPAPAAAKSRKKKGPLDPSQRSTFFTTQDPAQEPDDIYEDDDDDEADSMAGLDPHEQVARHRAEERQLEQLLGIRSETPGSRHQRGPPLRPGNLQGALSALRVALEHPIVHVDPAAPKTHDRYTNNHRNRIRTRVLGQEARRKRDEEIKGRARDRATRATRTANKLQSVDNVIDDMKKRLEVVEQNLATVLKNEQVLRQFPQSITLLEKAQREFERVGKIAVPGPDALNQSDSGDAVSEGRRGESRAKTATTVTSTGLEGRPEM